MAELADALDSGSSVRKDMGVQVPPLAFLSLHRYVSICVVIGLLDSGLEHPPSNAFASFPLCFPIFSIVSPDRGCVYPDCRPAVLIVLPR